MDVLSIVFKTRELTAHVRVVGTATKLPKDDTMLACRSSPWIVIPQSVRKLTMLEKIPLTMVQKLARSKRHMQHIPVITSIIMVRVHLSQRRFPKIT
jgi:hypothetical protein